jgi:hypothetical protein
MTATEQILLVAILTEGAILWLLFQELIKTTDRALSMSKDLLGILVILAEKNIITAQELRKVTIDRIAAYAQQLNDCSGDCKNCNKLNEE